MEIKEEISERNGNGKRNKVFFIFKQLVFCTNDSVVCVRSGTSSQRNEKINWMRNVLLCVCVYLLSYSIPHTENVKHMPDACFFFMMTMVSSAHRVRKYLGEAIINTIYMLILIQQIAYYNRFFFLRCICLYVSSTCSMPEWTIFFPKFSLSKPSGKNQINHLLCYSSIPTMYVIRQS